MMSIILFFGIVIALAIYHVRKVNRGERILEQAMRKHPEIEDFITAYPECRNTIVDNPDVYIPRLLDIIEERKISN